jgi:hypothetical protein
MRKVRTEFCSRRAATVAPRLVDLCNYLRQYWRATHPVAEVGYMVMLVGDGSS